MDMVTEVGAMRSSHRQIDTQSSNMVQSELAVAVLPNKSACAFTTSDTHSTEDPPPANLTDMIS